MRWMVFRGQLLTADSSSGLGVALRADALLSIPEVADAVDALPPRLVARAAMSEGELLALRLPQPACALLRLAQRKFTEAGDDVGAERAHILLVLTSARADAGEVDGRPELLPPPSSSARLGHAWALRRRVAEALRTGTLLPKVADASPELQLMLARRSEPAASPRAQTPVRVPPSGAASEKAYAPQAPVEVDPLRSSPVEREASISPPKSRRRVVVPVLVALVALLTLVAAVLIPSAPLSYGSDVPPTPTVPAIVVAAVVAIVVAAVVAIVAAVLVAIGWSLVRARRRRRSPPAETARHNELSLYEQQTVAAYFGPHGGTWSTCRLSVTSTELRISPDRGLALGDVEDTVLADTPAAGGVTAHARSRRPYVVIPLIELGPRAAGDRDQRFAVTTGQLSGLSCFYKSTGCSLKRAPPPSQWHEWRGAASARRRGHDTGGRPTCCRLVRSSPRGSRMRRAACCTSSVSRCPPRRPAGGCE